MMNHFKINFIYILLTINLLFSCNKLIEIPSSPKNALNADDVYNDSLTALGAIVGIYSNFGISNPSLSINSGAITVLSGMSGDELNYTGSSSTFVQFFNNSLLANNSNIENMLWNPSYTNLYQVNDAIDRLQNSQGITITFKKQLIGELKTVRAFYYFNLVNIFGNVNSKDSAGVPLVTDINYKISGKLPRSSISEIYAFIAKDLREAIELLSIEYPSAGHLRPNKFTAEALFSKVCLYRNDWENATKYANDIISSNKYNLEDSLDNVFIDGSREAIWQLPAQQTDYGTPEAVNFIPTRTKPNYPLSNLLLNNFEDGDRRKKKWVQKVTISDENYNIPFKYKIKNKPSNIPTEDYMIFRLAEQYLIRAESSANLGKYENALSDINIIRKRSGLPEYGGNGANHIIIGKNKNDIISALIKERQFELFCEWGNRWFDLKRLNIASQIISKDKLSSNLSISTNTYPIPQNQIRLNPFLKQNDGY